MSITYMNLTGDNIAPYKVNHFTWSASTNEVTANITISSSYIGAETDLTVELELDHEDKFNRDPNQNYFMPKQCFSITKNGQIYANREKLMRLQNGEIDRIPCDREVYQWEFDRQAEEDEAIGLFHGRSRPPIQQLRERAGSGNLGGDVLRDGRIRIDGRKRKRHR